jgi:hypothetical protein
MTISELKQLLHDLQPKTLEEVLAACALCNFPWQYASVKVQYASTWTLEGFVYAQRHHGSLCVHAERLSHIGTLIYQAPP